MSSPDTSSVFQSNTIVPTRACSSVIFTVMFVMTTPEPRSTALVVWLRSRTSGFPSAPSSMSCSMPPSASSLKMIVPESAFPLPFTEKLASSYVNVPGSSVSVASPTSTGVVSLSNPPKPMAVDTSMMSLP